MLAMPPIELHLANWPTALLAFVPMLANLGILLYGYRKLTHDAQNLLYLMFVAGGACWQMFDVGVRLAATPETAAIFRAVFRPGQLLTVTFGLHFVLLYVGLDRVARSPWLWAALYGPLYVVIAGFMSDAPMEVLAYRPGWGWLADPAQMHPLYRGFLAYGALLALSMLALLLHHLWKVRHDPARRAAASLLTAGMATVVVLGVSFETLRPVMGLPQWPITSSAGLVFSVCVLLGQRTYRLFDVSTPAAAKVVVQTVPDELLIAEASGQLLYANDRAARTLGLDPDKLGSYDIHDLFRDGGALAEAWRSLIDGKPQETVETRLQLADGSTAPFLASLAAIPLNRAGDVGVAMVAHHIGELKEVQQALEVARDEAHAANRSKSEFLASMSHELRTPLNGIIGYAEMLQDEVDTPDLREDLGRIRTSGRYLLELINDILDLSKVESGRLEVEPQPVALAHLVHDMSSSLGQLASNNRNELVVDVPDDLPQVHADPMRVRQVVLNLVSNAAKFCDDGRLTLRARREGEAVLFDVVDTGLGMSEAQSAKLFQRFSQVHEEGKERYGGTGLGLALSRSLCQLMGGDLHLERSAPGEGSTFRMTLPVVDASAS